ncbi:MAG: 1-deoxy-D-xylulose-5-phosphate reductoisomerase [Proteobacteria bacterium]|nr:1-deoxy-D-xylulose-5-phosphate reductoisomerase [Pseudomonadota bacterium]
MKRLSILGSTGSIGKNVCEVVRRFPERFSVTALAAGRNVDLLAAQIREFAPALAVLKEKEDADRLREMLGSTKAKILWGPEGYEAAAVHPDADMVASSIVGAAGLLPTMAALKAKKPVALANKETLVMAGELVMAEAARQGVPMLPVDSEHSAIFQCLEGRDPATVSHLILTASGGPFRTWPAEKMAGITPEDALNHPTWAMGAKISIDSATLMNKGLEVIEARWLFDMSMDRIQVLVHPQSIIHSMVAFHDGAILAQLGAPEMMGPIAYALGYPDRLPLGVPLPDFPELGSLTFEKPDLSRFPCLSLAFEAGARGKTYPAVLNAANEAAVDAFLSRRAGFSRIPELIRDALEAHCPEPAQGLEEILAADRWARAFVAGSLDRG